MFLYTSHWFCLSKWCFNTNTQLLLLFYRCQNFVSDAINGEMWADVALTVFSLHWAAWQARVTSAFLEYFILSLFHPVWHSSLGCWGHCGRAGDLDHSCSSDLCSQLPPSLCSWNLRFLTDFLESIGGTHFSSPWWPLQALAVFIPDVSQCLPWHQASLVLLHFGLSPSCAPIKPVMRLAAKIRWMGVCSLWDAWNFTGRVFPVRWRCSGHLVEFGQENHPRFQLAMIP